MVKMQKTLTNQTLTKKKMLIEITSRLIDLKFIYNRILKLSQVRPFDGTQRSEKDLRDII